MTKRGNVSFSSVAAVKRVLFSCFDAGRYLFNSLNNCIAVFLSSVCENWAMAAGTLRRWCRMTFCLWRWMYSGRLTKRARSVWGRMSWPGVQAEFQNTNRETTTRQRTDAKIIGISLEQRVFFALMVLLAAMGVTAGFSPVLDLALGWSLRRSERCLSFFFKREDDRASEL